MPPAATPEPDDRELEVIDDDELGDLLELSDPSHNDWVWWVYRIRSQDEIDKDPKRQPRVFTAKQVGPLDVMDIQRRYGGGRYELRGYKSRRLMSRKLIELAEPRADAPAPISTAPAPAPNSEVLTALTKLTEQVALLAARPATPAPAQGLDVEGAIKLFTTLAGMMPKPAPAAPSDAATTREMMTQMVGMFREGATIARETSENGGERSMAEVLIEKLTPAVERIATAVLTRRPAGAPPARRAAPPPANGSGAVVVEPTATATATPPATQEQESDSNFRIMAAVDAFARAIVADADPGDFAASLDHILNDTELDWMASKTAEQLMTEFAPVAERYPAFKTDAAMPFVQAVLAELQADDSDPVETQ